jgi:peptidoglycan/LPS O-acetylase OafA/YrhL
MAIGAEGNVKWVDGLRGIASALVVIKHLTCAWFPYLLWPAPSADEPPVLMELPFLRVLIQGRIGVAIFCLVTGYVCALKPVKCFIQGNHQLAYTSMSKSAIRRVPRLVLPVGIILLASCIATQLGAFETANHCDGVGIAFTSPNRRDNIFAAINALVHDFVSVWARGKSEYGSELWTMMPILKGAFWIYCFLTATAHVQQRWRMVIALTLTLLRAASNDPFFGMQFFFGAFLADLQNLEPGTFTRAQSLSTGPVRSILSVFCLVVGLYIGSLPDKNHEWQAWSLSLKNFLTAILPKDPDYPRFSSGLGLDIIAVGLHLSPLARNILSNRFFLWLGRMSFAVYLLHNQILRSVLCWMLYGFNLPEEGEPRLTLDSPIRLFMVVPFYLALTYGSAHLWTTYVDAWCARISERMVSFIKEDSGEKGSQPTLLPQHSARA